MCRKLPNVAARLPISVGVAFFREHLCFTRMISFNLSAKKYFSHSNKRCVVSAPSVCFFSSAHHDYPNRHVPSTWTGLLGQRNPIVETVNVCQTQVSHFSKLYACSTVRKFSSQSQSKVHEETKKLNVEDHDVLEDIHKNIIFKNGKNIHISFILLGHIA